jgi:hypothetical protein
MNIDIPKAEQEQLAQYALAAGYADVASCVTEYIKALAYQAPDNFEPLSPIALEASLKSCDQSMAEFDRGEGLTAEQDRFQSLENLRQNQQ